MVMSFVIVAPCSMVTYASEGMVVEGDPYLYKAGANLYDRERFAPVLFHFIFTELPAVHRAVR